jgi:hypothetical protein
MSEIISTKLLSEVLGSPVEIISIDEHKCEIRNSIPFENYQLGVSYSYLYGNKETRFMPVHELAHKCKEWAWKKCLLLNSGLDAESFYKNHNGVASLPNIGRTFYADSEYEAIFLACEYILNNIKQ